MFEMDECVTTLTERKRFVPKEKKMNQAQKDNLQKWEVTTVESDIYNFDDIFDHIYEEKFIEKLISSNHTGVTH